jgi:hypothetical protein
MELNMELTPEATHTQSNRLENERKLWLNDPDGRLVKVHEVHSDSKPLISVPFNYG